MSDVLLIYKCRFRLPLAVTLALAFATKRMTEENILVCVLGSCATMANASVVCTDKTGTLTRNVISVVAGSIGIHAKFIRKLEDNQALTNANEDRDHRRSFDSKVPRKDFHQENVILPFLDLFTNRELYVQIWHL